MRAVADGELEIGAEFADEMSYCLGCLRQTARPAGVNYAELFETARSDIETLGIPPGVMRKVARVMRFLFLHPRVWRGLGRCLPVQVAASTPWQTRGVDCLLPSTLRRLECRRRGWRRFQMG